MAASPKFMIGEAERRFPVRIKVALQAGGFGTRLTEINAWFDANCGADGWAMTPAGMRGMVNDAVAIHLSTQRSRRVSSRAGCATTKVESADGSFPMREDEPAKRAPLKDHKMP